MANRLLILLLMSIILSCNAVAQEGTRQAKTRQATSVQEQDATSAIKKHNPKKATIYSAVLPGLGQAYNKKYWKIPIVYAGIGTIYYIADMNGDSYRDYRDAFDYKAGLKTNVDKETIELANRYSSENLISIRDYYRRNMELSWIIMAIWYGVNIIDACVDAHFFEYDIGDDLTLKVEPVIQTNYAYWEQGIGYGNGYGSGYGNGNGSNYGISMKLKF